MPIEIRELVIKGNVGTRQARDKSGAGAADPAAESPRSKPLTQQERRDIVSECVHEVMERLSQSRDV